MRAPSRPAIFPEWKKLGRPTAMPGLRLRVFAILPLLLPSVPKSPLTDIVF